MRFPFAFVLFLLVATAPAQTPQWTLVPGLPAEQFTALFVRDNHLYAAGLDRIYHSTDGGQSWDTSAQILPGLDYINDFVEIDGVWFVATTIDGVFASTDEGQTWQAINGGLTGLGAMSPSMLARRDDFLYVSTNGAGVFRRPLTSPNPAWQPYNNQMPWGNVFGIINIDGQLLAGAGGNATLARNLPGTTVWLETAFDQFDGEISVFYNAVKVGATIIGVGSRGIFSSTDDAATWTEFDPGFGYIGQADLALHEGTVYALLTKASGLSTLGFSTDTGATWQAFDPAPGHSAYALAAHGNRLFVGRANGLWSIELPTTGLPPAPPRASIAVRSLSPNPARTDVELQLHLEAGTELSWRLYALTGEVVATRDFGRRPAGEQRIVVNVGDLPDGVYVYRLDGANGSVAGRLVVAK